MDTDNHNQIALLELLKASLYGVAPVLPDDLNWDEILEEARAQTVAALVAKAVPAEQQKSWQEDVLQTQANFIRVLHGQTRLVKTFEEAGAPLVILKGAAAAVYYPDPARRAMGDVDFLAPQDRYEDALRLMTEHGYRQFHEDERHAEFMKDGVEFELHRRFSYEDMDIEEYLVDGLSHPDWKEIGTHRFPMPQRLANGLVLLAHLRSHLKTGVGLRQMIDWMMYVDRELDDSFWESEFRQAAESKGLTSLAITATRLCQRYLGLSERITWCSDAVDGLCDRLLKLLFSSGNFGRKGGEQAHVEVVSAKMRRKGLFRYLQSSGERSWKTYHRYPILKPFCWIYRIVELTGKGIRTGRGFRVLGDIGHGKERYELLKELNIM